MKSKTDTIISALRVLSRDIQTDDGVVNACLNEAAGRLEELQLANKNTLADLAVAIERRDDSYAEIKTVRKELAQAIAERTPHDYGLLREEAAFLRKERDEARAEVNRVTKCCEQGDLMLQKVKDKLEKQEEISRDLYYERGLLQAEVNWFKEQPIERTNIRPEPSRLEIAALAMQAFIGSSAFIIDIPRNSLEYADALIAAAKEVK